MKLRFFVYGIVGLAVLTILISGRSQSASQTKTNQAAHTDSFGSALQIEIPSISVNASIEPIRVTSTGALDAPKDPRAVGWYYKNPRVGQVGTYVVDGHSGWVGNRPAVFDDLGKVKKGDKIFVLDGSGSAIIFVVRELRIYNEHDDTKSVFSSTDGRSHLNLITCEGTWDVTTQSYSGRLVVFADK